MLRIDQSIWCGDHCELIDVLMRLSESQLKSVEALAVEKGNTRLPEPGPKYVKHPPKPAPKGGVFEPDSLLKRNTEPMGNIGGGRLKKLHGVQICGTEDGSR